ncbi:hypothetical protein MMPV_008915 [Pyropia vietnamensis]
MAGAVWCWVPPPPHLHLPPRTLHLWLTRLPPTPPSPPPPGLPPTEVARAVSRLAHPASRAAHLVTRSMLRGVLGAYLGVPPPTVPLGVAPGGKPVLLGEGGRGVGVGEGKDEGGAAGEGELAFSVAHTTGLGLVAVARGAPPGTDSGNNDGSGGGLAIGVDIELADRPISDRLLRRVLTPAEWATLPPSPASTDPDADPDADTDASRRRRRAAVAAWTRKEAVVKATGRGIAGGMRAFEVATAPSPPSKGVGTTSADDDTGGEAEAGGLVPSTPSLLLSMAGQEGLARWTLLDVPLASHGAAGAVAVWGGGGVADVRLFHWPPVGEPGVGGR